MRRVSLWHRTRSALSTRRRVGFRAVQVDPLWTWLLTAPR